MLLLNDLPGTHFFAVFKPLVKTVPDSSPAVEPPAAPLGGRSMNVNAASPSPENSADSKDPMSVDVAARASTTGPVVFISSLDDPGNPSPPARTDQDNAAAGSPAGS